MAKAKVLQYIPQVGDTVRIGRGVYQAGQIGLVVGRMDLSGGRYRYHVRFWTPQGTYFGAYYRASNLSLCVSPPEIPL